MYSSSLPFERGGTLFEKTPDTAPSNTDLGMVVVVPDTRNNTQRPVRLRKVLNASGGSLSGAGRAVRYTAGAYGLTIAGYAKNITDPYFAGWIDEARSLSIASNDVFWIVEPGFRAPHDREHNTLDLYPPVADFLANRCSIMGVVDDFTGYALSAEWTTMGSGGTTTATNDAVGGTTILTSTATTDNACWGVRTKELFKFDANMPLVYEIRVKPTEHNTDDANFGFGVCNAVSGTVPLANDGGAAPASGSFAYVYKVDGGTVWQAAFCINSTSSNDTDIGAVVTGAWVTFRIEWVPTSATHGICKFYMDGTLVHTTSSVAIASATEMSAFAAVKGGSTTGTPNIEVDRIACVQMGNAA